MGLCNLAMRRRGVLRASALVAALVTATLVIVSDPLPAVAVAIGEGNNATGIAYEGSGHTLMFRWQTYGSSGWTPEQAAGPDTTYSTPSVAEGNNSTSIAYQGFDHTLIFRWQTYGSSGWNREQVAGPKTTYSAPSLAESDNATAIAVEGANHSLDFYWQTYGTQQWNEEVVARSGAAYSAPSLAEADSDGYEQNDIFVEGPQHSLSDWEQEGNLSSNWWLLEPSGPDTVYSAPSAVDLAETSGGIGGIPYVSMECAWEGRAQMLLYYYSAWSGQAVEPVAGPGSASSGPSLTVGNNATEIAVDYDGSATTGGGLSFYWQPIDGTSWNPETINNTNYAWSPPAISTGNNATTVAVEGTDHSLVFYWQTSGSSSWNQEFAASNWTTYS